MLFGEPAGSNDHEAGEREGEPAGGNHIVAYRTSKNLVKWGDRHIAFTDPTVGTFGGPTESPFVVQRGKFYYLFIGPRGDYVGTDIFRSMDPFQWKLADKVGHINSHAAEVVRDTDGRWYVSHSGWGQGVFNLSKNAGGDLMAGRAATDETMLDPATWLPVQDEAILMRYSEMFARISTTLARGAVRQ